MQPETCIIGSTAFEYKLTTIIMFQNKCFPCFPCFASIKTISLGGDNLI